MRVSLSATLMQGFHVALPEHGPITATPAASLCLEKRYLSTHYFHILESSRIAHAIFHQRPLPMISANNGFRFYREITPPTSTNASFVRLELSKSSQTSENRHIQSPHHNLVTLQSHLNYLSAPASSSTHHQLCRSPADPTKAFRYK